MVSIPKIFHQIWLWGELPFLFKEYQNTWIKFNPNWKLKVWNEKNISRLKYLNKDILASLPNFAEKSDYLRIIILLEFWGVYIDTDFECYKNIDFLLKNCNFCIWEQFYYEYPNAFIGASPEHPILKLILMKIPLQIKKEYMVSEDKTWPRFISRVINQNREVNIKVIAWFLLYPEYWLHIRKAYKNKTKIFASHHYNALSSKKAGVNWKMMFLKQKFSWSILWRYFIIVLHILIRTCRYVEYCVLDCIYKLK